MKIYRIEILVSCGLEAASRRRTQLESADVISGADARDAAALIRNRFAMGSRPQV
jgi:hypothetical protein